MKDRISESVVIEDPALAEYYSRMARRHMRIPCQRVLKRVLAKGVGKGTALDVGTGPGVFPIFLSKALPGIRFKGIDLSAVMIEIAGESRMSSVFGLKVRPSTAIVLPRTDPPQAAKTLRAIARLR